MYWHRNNGNEILDRSQQVLELVYEYLSHPASTLFVMKDMDFVPAPAFTFCPRPSLSSNALGRQSGSSSVNPFLIMPNSTVTDSFKKLALSMEELFLQVDDYFINVNDWIFEVENTSTINGETIMHLANGEDQVIFCAYIEM